MKLSIIVLIAVAACGCKSKPAPDGTAMTNNQLVIGTGGAPGYVCEFDNDVHKDDWAVVSIVEAGKCHSVGKVKPTPYTVPETGSKFWYTNPLGQVVDVWTGTRQARWEPRNFNSEE